MICSEVDNLKSVSNDSINICSTQTIALPTNFDSWKRLYWPEEGFGWQWELLRPFFANKGYNLYVHRESAGLKPEVENDPADDSFGLLGVRTNFRPLPLFLCNVRIILSSYSFESYSVNLQRGEVWGARDMSVSQFTVDWSLISL